VRIPNCEAARVPEEKITDYLLDPEHPEGAPKAEFFTSHGFSRDKADELAEALLRHCAKDAVAQVVQGEFGTKYVIEAAIRCPDGLSPMCRSVWIITGEDPNPRLVTAYPFD
jgi:hypothetical protein